MNPKADGKSASSALHRVKNRKIIRKTKNITIRYGQKKDSGQKFVESVSESDGALQRAPALELILSGVVFSLSARPSATWYDVMSFSSEENNVD